METAVKAASWVVGKALAPITGGLLEAWAASEGLGPNVEALKEELLYAQAMLENAQEREIRSPALKELLHKLRQLAYNADDLLDDLEYFRIQDEVDGTYHAADAHAAGCVRGLALNARHTARAVAAKLKPSSAPHAEDDDQDNSARQGCLSSLCSCGGRTVSSSPPSPTNQDEQKTKGRCMQKLASIARNSACGVGNGREMSSPRSPPTNWFKKRAGCGCLPKVTSPASDTAKYSIGKLLPCCPFQSVDGNEKPFLCGTWKSKAQQRKTTSQQESKLKFNRVEISKKMNHIIEHLKPVCAKVSNILNLEFMGTNRVTAMKRPKTTSDITEDKLYGRGNQKDRVRDDIIKNFANKGLAVLLVVGPGGIGKTTFIQHVYKELKGHFDITIWLCVSLNFSASRLAQEAKEKIPEVEGEKKNCTDQELIEQRLKAKRFLLVLDDMWECHEDEWKKLLAPFGRGEEKGNMVIVTSRFDEVAKTVNRAVDCPIQTEHLERLQGKDFMDYFEACAFDNQQSLKDHPELHEIGEQIVSKLKGFPLAAKTVGRLLRNQLTSKHWSRVLESKEWELQTDDNDIMPALRLSYDYLPFHLQQCFYYCALFPEDYEFDGKELVHLWIGLDIIHPCGLNRRIEDVGQMYLNDLVNHGFFKKNERNGGCPYYVVHDLLHELATNISSFECLTICSSNVKSIQSLQDVRHLSIIVDKKDVEDIKTFKYYKNDLRALGKRLKIENLRTLMVFGEHHGSFTKTFRDLFEKAIFLRVIYLSEAEYTMENMAHTFSKLIHLRYLRITMAYKGDFNHSTMSRLYHLEVIDLPKFKGRHDSTRLMSNLPKLRYFIVPKDELQLHSNIVDVGKLELFQELRSFEVRKEDKGFELNQLGKLSELGGSLAICCLQRIQSMEEVHEARLIQLKHLQKLTLEWDTDENRKDTAYEENVLEILMPQSNLQGLCIRGHGGTKRPQWLGENLSLKNLKSLCLDGVAWELFPPIGELRLADRPCEEISSNIPNAKFHNLRRLEFIKLQRLKEWVVDTPCQLFAHLEVLIVKDCPKLTKLSFSHSTCCHQEREAKVNWFPSLQELKIEDCPELQQFPPIPWRNASCSANIEGVGLGLKQLICGENFKSEYRLKIEGKDAPDRMLWDILAFHNLAELKELVLNKCPPLSLHHLQMLSSLKNLEVSSSTNVFVLEESEDHAHYRFQIERIEITSCGASGKELTHLLTCLPNLSELKLWSCEKISGLDVAEQQQSKAAHDPSRSSSGNEVHQVQNAQQQQDASGEKEITAALVDDGVLLLPPQLQDLGIYNCPDLILHFDPLDDSKGAAGSGGGGGGLQGLRSLRSLGIGGCPRFLSSYSPSSFPSCSPFPNSLERLTLSGITEGMETLLPLSNLTSLTYLTTRGCGDLRGEGLWPLLAQGHLTALDIRTTPNFFAGSEPPLPHEQALPSSSTKPHMLHTDDVTGFLATPICNLLSSWLTQLDFVSVEEVERFTEKQEEALALLASLELIGFSFCDKLQCLPAGLRGLPKLKILHMFGCAAIRSVPKDCLPNSLQKLEIYSCEAMRYLPKDSLPSSLEELYISWCPAMQPLPKVDSLPKSLRVLDVQGSRSEVLRRQCRKLIGIIPIVRA